MANKRIDELTAKTSLVVGDNLVIYDSEEVGAETAKKITTPNAFQALYNAGDKKIETTATGISITDGTAVAATIGFDSDDLEVDNNDPGGKIILTGEKAATGESTLTSFDPDGAAELYHAGTKVLETMATGIETFGMQLARSSGHLVLDNTNDGGNIYLRLTNTVLQAMVQITANGGIILYQKGLNSMTIGDTPGKVLVYNSFGNGYFTLEQDGSNNSIWQNNADGADVYIKGEVATDTVKTIFKGAPDGAAELYYAGVKKFETTATGVDVDGDITIDAVPADGTASGVVITGTVDTNAFGVGALLLLGADGNWDTADADAEATCDGMLGLALTAGTGASKKILLQGFLTLVSTWEWGTIGGKLYASASVGELTLTAPVGGGDIVRIVGYSTSADTIYFDPDKTYVEV